MPLLFSRMDASGLDYFHPVVFHLMLNGGYEFTHDLILPRHHSREVSCGA